MKRGNTHLSIIFWVAALLTAPTVQAEIFKCTEADGHVTYSNVVGKNCKALNLDPVSSGNERGNKSNANKANTKDSPSGFPKVNESTQKARDTDRRRILENELLAEQNNLAQAKQDIAEQEAMRNGDERNYQKVLDRVQPFKDKAVLHERNIEAIKKEIANLR
ncbi:MAG: DUF4124 domain-containing protein [Pseudomonadota bacterium]